MKTVFRTQELPHIWMSQSQDEGRVSGGNFYFEGKTIYSYGTHFPIARILEKEKVIFFTNRSFSNSTAKHISHTMSAIDRDYEVVYFSYPDLASYSSNMFNFEIDRLKDIAEEYPRARTRKDVLISEFETIQRHMMRVVEILKIKTKLSKVIKLWLNANPQELVGVLEEEIKQLNKIRIARNKREAEKRAKALEDAYADLEKWKSHDPKISTYSFRSLGNKAYLRIKGDEVETSMGATIKMRSAEILFRMIDAGKEVKGHRIDDSYIVKSINGSLEVGCHSIPKDEIYDFAKRMNWI